MKYPDDKVTYIDIPDVFETFVDSVNTFTLEGQITRMELCVTRIGEINPPKEPSPKRYPACRLILTPEAVVDIHNRLKGMISIMEKTGVISRKPQAQQKEPVMQ